MLCPLRRACGVLVVGMLLLCALPVHAFDFFDVARQARDLAAGPWQSPARELPERLRALNPGQYHAIRHARSAGLWTESKGNFEVSLLPRGMRFENEVAINVIEREGVKPLPYRDGMFDFADLEVAEDEARELGFAGFRVHFPLNDDTIRDEVLSFLGASYFRALGEGQVYGISARGLAIDTALPSGEEFPFFRAFWLVRPAPQDKHLTIYALLDSPSVTGAYRFVLTPGVSTEVAVRARLYARQKVAKLGIAPLTSMFFFGENQLADRGDFRPEVHDSDGFLLQSADGGWLWRPLANPRRLLVSSFDAPQPRGFGLMQRDRNFDSYQELTGPRQMRPSVWVTPRGDWGEGQIELVQIPTPSEANDNVVAYWIPKRELEPGGNLEFEYLLSWQMRDETRPETGWVTQTRAGRSPSEQQEMSRLRPERSDDASPPQWLRVDFTGPALADAALLNRIEVELASDDNALLVQHELRRNESIAGFRLVLTFRRIKAGRPTELRARLVERLPEGGSRALTETWSYLLPGS